MSLIFAPGVLAVATKNGTYFLFADNTTHNSTQLGGKNSPKNTSAFLPHLLLRAGSLTRETSLEEYD